MFQVYDLNNWVRIKLESDMTGQPLRHLWNEIITSPFPQLWVADGANANQRRRRLYPEYKLSRKKATDETYHVFKLLKQALVHAPGTCCFCEVPGYEADDTIAALVKKLNLGTFELFSTDRDLSQLEGAILPYELKIPRTEIRLYKTMVGDPSDNLKGIPKFGKVSWGQLTSLDKTILTMALDYHQPIPEPYTKWENNMRLGWELTGFMLPSDNALLGNLIRGDGNLSMANEILNYGRL